MDQNTHIIEIRLNTELQMSFLLSVAVALRAPHCGIFDDELTTCG